MSIKMTEMSMVMYDEMTEAVVEAYCDVLFQSALLATYTAYSSTLKTEAVCSSEMFENFYQTIQCYIPEDSTLL
jgi:hypothetical protein